MPFHLETNRLALRHLSLADAPFLLTLMNSPDYLRFIGDRGVRSVADAEKFLEEKMISSYARLGFGLYGVELRESSELIGICGFVQREYLPSPDLGFAFLPAVYRQGYAVESSLAVLEYARTSLGLKKIYGICSPENMGSIRVLEKIGLHFEKLIEHGTDKSMVKLFST